MGNPFLRGTSLPVCLLAHKSHMNFSPHSACMEVFREELADYKTTKHSLQIPYNEPLMEDLIQRMAEYCVPYVSQREDSNFWEL